MILTHFQNLLILEIERGGERRVFLLHEWIMCALHIASKIFECL